ncbi:MAG: hypothetical protein AAFR61_22965 [Bacteroidota bacterium]
MTFLYWVFGIFFTIYVVFRLFGRQILRLSMQRLVKKLAQNMEKQAMQYERNYSNSHYQENVYVDQDIKVSAPKEEQKTHVSSDDIAEDIEFEEIKE